MPAANQKLVRQLLLILASILSNSNSRKPVREVYHILLCSFRLIQLQYASVKVLTGVSIAAVLAALPFLSSTVRQREQAVANMRDAAIDAKDEARNARLRTSSK